MNKDWNDYSEDDSDCEEREDIETPQTEAQSGSTKTQQETGK